VRQSQNLPLGRRIGSNLAAHPSAGRERARILKAETGPKAQAKTARAHFLGKFTELKGAARELWITFVVKLLVIAAYAFTDQTVVHPDYVMIALFVSSAFRWPI
jgi:hypothetical protein